MIDLLETQTAQLYRVSEGSGYLNDNNEWVEEGFEQPEDLICNIQPLTQGKKKVILPDGIRADHVQELRCRTKLTVADQYLKTTGDEVFYKGYRYEIFKEEDYSDYGLMSDHFKYLIVRKDNS